MAAMKAKMMAKRMAAAKKSTADTHRQQDAIAMKARHDSLEAIVTKQKRDVYEAEKRRQNKQLADAVKDVDRRARHYQRQKEAAERRAERQRELEPRKEDSAMVEMRDAMLAQMQAAHRLATLP